MIHYDSDQIGSPAIHELRELVRYRDLLRILISNSIKTRYKRSSLGVVWTLLNPLLNTLVLTLAFSQIFRFNIENYAVYILSGLLFWNFFAQTTTLAMNQLIWGSSLLRRIYVPRSIFSVAVVGNGLANFFLALIPLGAVMLALGAPFTSALLFIPFAAVLMLMFILGVTLLVSTLAVFFVDVVDIYGVVISAVFYLTPIIYPISMLPEGIAAILRWNPLYIMVELLRAPVYLGVMPDAGQIAAAAAVAVVTLLVGWGVFTSRMEEFAYQL
jgi:ABC-type polysaccharide/polyol phosphate export permease